MVSLQWRFYGFLVHWVKRRLRLSFFLRKSFLVFLLSFFINYVVTSAFYLRDKSFTNDRNHHWYTIGTSLTFAYTTEAVRGRDSWPVALTLTHLPWLGHRGHWPARCRASERERCCEWKLKEGNGLNNWFHWWGFWFIYKPRGKGARRDMPLRIDPFI